MLTRRHTPSLLSSLTLFVSLHILSIFFQTHVFIPQGYFSECLFIILSFARLLPPPHAMTSYFLNWLSSSVPLLMLKCPFFSEELTLLNCFLFLDNQKLLNELHYQWLLPTIPTFCVCARVSVCVSMCMFDPVCCSHRFHINLNPAFFQIRFLFFCLYVDLFASLSSSPARLSWGRQHFYGNKGVWRWGGGPGCAASHALIDLV